MHPSFLKPEVSARRVASLVQMHVRGRRMVDGNPFEDIMDTFAYRAILEDANLWISQEWEARVIQFLADKEDISLPLYQIGKETLLAQSYEILPSNDEPMSVQDFIPRLPIALARLTRIASLEVLELAENRAVIELVYGTNFQEKWYDVVFIKGILDGVAILFELIGSRTSLRETKLLGIHSDHRELGDSIQFGAGRNVFEIQWTYSATRVARTKLLPESQEKVRKAYVISRDMRAMGEELSVVNLKSIIEKSRELAVENRDLGAAVEVLNSLKTELEIRQKAIETDLKLARSIQQGIIPQSLPNWLGFEFSHFFKPMQEVSGDYYDFIPIGREMWGLVLCDVSGHGVPAAFITALSKLLFSFYRNPKPSRVFVDVNKSLLELLRNQGYATSVFGVLDRDCQFHYSLAGHPPPVFLDYQSQKARFLEGEGTFLGMFLDAGDSYRDYRVTLSPGDKIFLYTDGLLEAPNVAGEVFGEERLLECIEQTRDLRMGESVRVIQEKFRDFTKGTDSRDDVTLLGWQLVPEYREFRKWNSRGTAHYSRREYEKSAKCLAQADALLPGEIHNSLDYARVLTKTGEYQKASAILANYNQFKIHNYESHLLSGFCYYQMGEFEKAEAEWKKSLYMDSHRSSVYNNLIRVYQKLGKMEKARQIFKRMKKLFPNFARLSELESKLNEG